MLLRCAFYLFLLMFATGSDAAENKLHEELKYFTPLTTTEQRNIHFIITTLGTKSTLSLLLYRDDLNRAGHQIFTVHPLRFWKEIITDSNLKYYSKRIGFIPKRHMIGDFIKSFQWVRNKGLFTEEQIIDFCSVTGLNKDLILTLVKEAQWNKLVDLLFQRLYT